LILIDRFLELAIVLSKKVMIGDISNRNRARFDFMALVQANHQIEAKIEHRRFVCEIKAFLKIWI